MILVVETCSCVCYNKCNNLSC